MSPEIYDYYGVVVRKCLSLAHLPQYYLDDSKNCKRLDCVE